MNEQIKTMWEEATLSHWPRPGKFTAGEYDSHLEKFAELIVKECAAIASNTNLEDVDGGDSAVLGAAREQILEHFGVEE